MVDLPAGIDRQRPAAAVSIVEHLESLRDSDRPAFTCVDFRSGRDGDRQTLSWAEVRARAAAVGARLRQLARPGARVAILCPQNLDYIVAFYGCLYADVIAVPLFSPSSGGTNDDRLTSALADSDPEVWLTSSARLPAATEFLKRQPVPEPKHLLVVDQIGGDAGGFTPFPAGPTDIAYLQYTSGSTRSPTGAVITHGALLANLAQAMQAFDFSSTSTCVGWIPFFHDMGLMLLVAMPAYTSSHSVFLSPSAFIRRPARWLNLLGEFPNVITAAPNFAYEYAAGALSERDRSALDLSGVSVSINGAEPIRPEAVESFLTALGPRGLRRSAHRPSYGLAEAVVLVSSSPAGTEMRVETVDRDRLSAGELVPVDAADPAAQELVSVGRPAGQQVVIVDPGARTPVPDGEVGEIWVNGPNVAAGYWQDAESSARLFDVELVGAGPELPARGWLRTGDLGVYHDGELFVTGRIKDLIIVDGKNHYPQDIEGTVQAAHPAIRRGRVAVFAVEHRGGDGVVAVVEHRGAAVEDEVAEQVRAAVARQHDLRLVDLALVRPGGVSRTSSGKVARAATRDRYLSGTIGAESGTP